MAVTIVKPSLRFWASKRLLRYVVSPVSLYRNEPQTILVFDRLIDSAIGVLGAINFCVDLKFHFSYSPQMIFVRITLLIIMCSIVVFSGCESAHKRRQRYLRQQRFINNSTSTSERFLEHREQALDNLDSWYNRKSSEEKSIESLHDKKY